MLSNAPFRVRVFIAYPSYHQTGELRFFSVTPYNWSPRPFANLLNMRQTHSVRLAYGFQRIDMAKEGHNPKLLIEWEMFARFCRAAGLDIHVGRAEMLDPDSSRPAPPDLRCWHNDEPLYVELGEVIQENLAERLAIASARPTRKRDVAEQQGVFTLQETISPSEAKRGQVAFRPLPLLQVGAPLEEMLTKKLNKRYNPDARPLALLLYYSTVRPFWEQVEPLIIQKRAAFREMLESSPFDYVWIFDAPSREVLFGFARPSPLVAP